MPTGPDAVGAESISCPATDNEKIMASQKIPIIIIIGEDDAVFVNDFGFERGLIMFNQPAARIGGFRISKLN